MTLGAGIPGVPKLWRLADGAAPKGPHVALVPGIDAPVLPVDVPDKLGGAAREQVANRFFVETLSLPAMAFEVHPIQPKGKQPWRHAIVVSAERANDWRSKLSRGVIAAVPEFFALPAAHGLWSIFVEDDRVIVRVGPTDGFSAETDLAVTQLAQMPEPQVILRLGAPAADLDDLLEALDLPIVADVKDLKTHGLAPMRWTDSLGSIDLKSRPSAAVDRVRSAIKRWRLGFMAASLALAAWLGTLFLETRNADAQADLSRDRIQSLVREHFVPSGPILDVRAQVAAALETALKPAVIELQTIPALDQFQIAANALAQDGATVLSASYRAETGLETDIAADNFTILDDVIIALQDADFLVEQIDSRTQQTGGVIASLRLELF